MYRLEGHPVEELSDDQLADVRSQAIGFVFQSYNLLPRTSALENVATPLLYQGVSRRDRLARAQAALERLGLGRSRATTSRASYPVASSSAWRSPAPW